MKRGISQEALKILACVTMLLDHIGAVYYPGSVLRDIGRISFPIFCFLLAEGYFHTHSRKRYALRLILSAMLAEVPFDLAFYGRIYWGHQNVMVTLFLGLLAVWAVQGSSHGIVKAVVAFGAILAAEYLQADYGGTGVLLILLFALTREMGNQTLIRTGVMLILFGGMSSMVIGRLGSFLITQQMLGVLSMIPIALYSGEKKTGSIWVQRFFYLFYPAHLLALVLAQRL